MSVICVLVCCCFQPSIVHIPWSDAQKKIQLFLILSSFQLALDSSHYLENALNITKFFNKVSFQRFRQPINRTDWTNHASVAIVNAFYNWHQNSIGMCSPSIEKSIQTFFRRIQDPISFWKSIWIYLYLK